MMIRLFVFILILQFFACQSTEVEDPNFIGKADGKYLPAKDTAAKTFLKEVLDKNPNFPSFKSDFSMQIQTFVPKKDNVLRWKGICFQRYKTSQNPIDGPILRYDFY